MASFLIIPGYVMGYTVAKHGIVQADIPIYTLDQKASHDPAFYVSNPVYHIQSIAEINALHYYLLVPDDLLGGVQIPVQAQIVGHYYSEIPRKERLLVLLSLKNAMELCVWDTLYRV